MTVKSSKFKVESSRKAAASVKSSAVVDRIGVIEKAGKRENKSVTVKARYLKISFQKLNLLAKIIRRRRLLEAERIVNFKSSKAARFIGVLLKSGKAAASERRLNLSHLWVAELLAQQGPSLKRGQAVARGSFHSIRKKTAHLVLRLQENYGTED